MPPMTLPINVTSTSNNMDTLSRNELVGFINDTLALNYTKVEQMCSGNYTIIIMYNVYNIIILYIVSQFI